MTPASAAFEVAPAALCSFAAYLLVVVGIGAWASRFSSGGLSEFYLAGRSLSRVVVALSAVVSGRSAWLLVGFTGLAYARGLSAIWAAAGYIAVEALLFWFYAPRIRRLAGARDCITVPDVFAARFGGDGEPGGRAVRVAVVSVTLLFMVSYVAAQFVAGGKSFASSFGVEPVHGVLFTAAIVLVYTVLGGFLAVSLTDVAQAALMLVALVALPAVAVRDAGGLGPVVDQLRAADAALLDPAALSFGALVGFLGIGLGSPGNPHILVRFMSIDDPAELRVSAIVGTAWNIVMALGALAIGLVGRVAYPAPAMLPAGDVENLYPALAYEHLPPFVFGIVIASIFAAIMSTADSQLLVAASGVVRDVWEKLLRRGRPLDRRRTVLASRLVILALVVLAVAAGLAASGLVFWLVLFAWAGLGAALGPTSILALWWRRTTAPGVIAGIVCGTLTVVAWQSVPALDGLLYELVPAFAASAAGTVIVSLLSRPPDDAAALFDAMDGRGETRGGTETPARD